MSCAGRGLEEETTENRVDAHRFPAAGRAGDEQVRHAGEIADHRVSADVGTERNTQLVAPVRERRRLDRLLEAHQLRRLVGHLDADRGFARDERLDTDRRGQRERQVGLIPEDATHRHADGGLELVLRDRRPAVRSDDPGLDAEGLQGAHDLVTCGTNFGGEALALAGDGVEQVGGRQDPDLLRLVVDHHRVADADLGNRPDQHRCVPGRGGNTFELAREAVLPEVLAGRLRLLRVEEGGRRRRSLGRIERQHHGNARKLRGRLRCRRREDARSPAGDADRTIAAQPLPFGGEPAAERPDHGPGAEIGGQDHAEQGDHDQRRARARATEHPLHARADPGPERAGVSADHADQPEEGEHGEGAAQCGQRSRSPLGGHAQPRAGQDETGDTEPGSHPEGSEEPVVHRSGDRPTSRKDEHRGEDHPGADGADPGQLAAQVAMQQRRSRPSRRARP